MFPNQKKMEISKIKPKCDFRVKTVDTNCYKGENRFAKKEHDKYFRMYAVDSGFYFISNRNHR